MATADTQRTAAARGRPSLGFPVAWLVLLVGVAYLLRAGELPLRGEEPTRAQIALEMVGRGDWIVPRVQGEPFRIRPPLQNWLIAASCLICGSWEPWAVRLPSVLATLFTTLMVYGYGRRCLSRSGAFTAAVACATMADMFQMGRQAETEAIFIALVSAALLVWHWSVIEGWPDAVAWAAGYSLMALGMLTKGLQAPTYFILSTSAYLLVTRQWRRLLTTGHLLGAIPGALILAAWMIPYGMDQGWMALKDAWLGDPALRPSSWNWSAALAHLFTYPAEVVAGTLPWSLLLLPYLWSTFRQALGNGRPQVLFLSICLAVAFPTCWLHPGGQPRFFAPLFPCLAVLIGIAAQRCAEAAPGSTLHAAWRRFVLTVVAVMILAAGAASVAACCNWAAPRAVALAYAIVALGLVMIVLRSQRQSTAVAALACFLVLTFTGIVSDVRLRRSENAGEAIRSLKACLPPAQPLVSFGGRIDCLFSYYYGSPFIAPRPMPTRHDDGAGVTYFCIECPGDSRPELPFAWEQIAAISLDRNRRPVPERIAVVGRRIREPGTE